MSEPPFDETGRFLADLEERLRHELAGVATVDRAIYEQGIVAVHITPVNDAALWVNWADLTGDVVLSAGTGGRWELDRSRDDMAFLEDVVRSVVAGRVVETTAPMRSYAEITLTDGSVEPSTVYDGCLTLVTPLPGWRRWGRRTEYASYR